MLEVLPFGEDPDLSGTVGPAVPQHLPPCPIIVSITILINIVAIIKLIINV